MVVEQPPNDESRATGTSTAPNEEPRGSGARPSSATADRREDGKPRATVWERATYRWVAVVVVLGALYALYFAHPYFNGAQFTPFKSVFPAACGLWLCLGIPYVKATLERFSERRYVVRDSALHLLLLAKSAFGDRFWRGPVKWTLAVFAVSLRAARWIARPGSVWHGSFASVAIYVCALLAVLLVCRDLDARRVWRAVRNRRVRTTLLGIVVKGFFTPLMIGFVTGHLNGISRAWLSHKNLPPMDFKVQNGASVLASLAGWWTHVGSRAGDLVPSLHDLFVLVTPWTWTRAEFSWGLGLAYDVIFAIDCGWALVGYAGESRWLGNKTRSVEPTAFGWMVCLACYPPFNNVLGTYLPLENGPLVVEQGSTTQLVLRSGVVVLFAIYASATVSFGFKFSNLTNRGIVSRGPYRFVRHPAYLCKCSAWWLEHIPTMTMTKAFFLTLLCGVYALRAWTEERHLGRDADYLAYKKKTRWVLLPGVY